MGNKSMDCRLVATVEQVRKERDAAVDDADTLRQARQLAAMVQEGRPGWYHDAYEPLLDLLSSPVPGTPTPTGQT